jgi:hypothetical protein
MGRLKSHVGSGLELGLRTPMMETSGGDGLADRFAKVPHSAVDKGIVINDDLCVQSTLIRERYNNGQKTMVNSPNPRTKITDFFEYPGRARKGGQDRTSLLKA